MDDRKDIALDICWELRLEPRIGVYRRAMVNLLIAQILPYDQMKYAEECLDLLDILTQDNNGEVSDNIKNVISIAEDLIEELEVKQQELKAAGNGGDTSSRDDTSMKNASGKGPDDEETRIIYVYETDKNTTDDGIADRNNTVTIEGMLRDSRYKPRVKQTAARTAGR